jgi:hypothetical protein
MKKFLLLAVITVSALFSQAQVVTLTGSSYGNALDTVTNTGTVYLTTPANALNSNKSGKYIIQLDATNKSGTTTITAVLQSSLDGVTWGNHFKTPGQTGVNCDTLAISGTTTHIYNVLPGSNAWYASITYPTNSGRRLYFRVKLVGGATGTTQVKAKLITQE